MNSKESLSNESFFKSLQDSNSVSQALGLSDNDVEQIAGLAAAFYQEERLDSAFKLLEGLTCLRPERSEFWSALGAVLTRMERHEEALPILTAAIRMDPRDAAALVNRAECYIALTDNERAAEDLEAAIKLDPKEENPAANRARQMAHGFAQFFEQCHEAGLDTIEVEDEEE